MRIFDLKRVYAAVFLLVLFAGIAYAVPGIPHQFYGTVTVNGAPAADGTVVNVKIIAYRSESFNFCFISF